MAQSDDGRSDASTTPPGFDWGDRTPAASITIEVCVPRKEFHWLKQWELKDVKAMRPCDGKWKKEDQKQLHADIQRVTSQPFREEGDDTIVTEKYASPKNGFPGRLYSPGCQGLCRPVRSNLLSETADMDMSMAMPRILLWVCSQFSIHSPHLEYFVAHRDGPGGMLQRLMDEMNVTKAKAKQLSNIPWTMGESMRTSNKYLKAMDKEAKSVQQALMARPELQWIIPLCKEGNRPGSFISHLFHWIECKLLVRVYRMLIDELKIPVAALVFDGLNLADKTKYGDQTILDRAHAVCEEVCPGINMIWAWKELDFAIESADKLEKIKNADGTIKELRVPADFSPPPPRVEDSADDSEGELDPETEPSYEQLRTEFSLGLEGKHGKVGSEYICVEDDGKLTLFDTSHFKARFCHMKYFEIEEGEKTDDSFIDKWMKDPRMDPRYLQDKIKKYYWDRFDMYPNAADCPPNVYNLWKGFAAEKMSDEYDDDVRAGLSLVLEHIKMLCSGNAAQYDFLLNILAHAVQFPNVKLGIMLCLVGKQGCGKGHIWEVIERIIGLHGCFTTDEPQKDVWGDNNGRMKDAFFVRIQEASKAQFTGYVGKLRGKVTDNPIRVRDLYCAAANVKNFSRFFLDTNFVDAIPDEHGERRFFIVKCSEAMIGNHDYFDKLRDAISDERVIHAFFDFLKTREIKKMYMGKDIPSGAYQQALKDSRRSIAEHFIEWLVQNQPLTENGVPTGNLELSSDAIYELFKVWQQNGNEFERSKESILRELRLKSIDGVTAFVRDEDKVDETADGPILKRYQKRGYTFDLIELRARYEIGADTPTPVAVTPIDCERDIAQWEAKTGRAQLPTGEAADAVMDTDEAGPSGVPPPAVGEKRGRDDDDSDDDDVSPMELGRRMYSRGEMPSPGDADVNKGYHMARAVENPGRDNCPFAHANNVEQQQGCPYCDP